MTAERLLYPVSIAGGKCRVELALDAADDILMEVTRAFAAIPKRGAECGGLLLGRTREGVVTIEEFRPIPIEHSRGPSYRLSERDLYKLSDVVREPRGLTVVGMMRSHTRNDAFGPGPEDALLLERFCQADPAVFLFIRPYPTRPPEAVYVVRMGGETIPFDETFVMRRREMERTAEPMPESPAPQRTPEPAPAALPVSVAMAATNATALAPVLSTAPAARPIPAEPVQTRPSIPVAPPVAAPPSQHESVVSAAAPQTSIQSTYQAPARSASWLPVLIAVLTSLLLGGEISSEAAEQRTSADPYSLSLRTAGSSHVEWNAHAPVVSRATAGALFIEEGSFQHHYALTREQLSSGSFILDPSTVPRRVRLEFRMPTGVMLAQTVEVPAMVR